MPRPSEDFASELFYVSTSVSCVERLPEFVGKMASGRHFEILILRLKCTPKQVFLRKKLVSIR